jgi:3-deoxy-D-manno-octulosonic-acid transferase
MYPIYLFLIHLLVPFAELRLFLLTIRNPQYRTDWRQRFGIVPGIKNRNKLIWIHAVSVGEVNAAKPLVDYFQNHYQNYDLLITTVTAGGADAVKKNFSGEVSHRYLPYDIPICVNRFLGSIKPCLLVIMETEIWPTLYYSCHIRNIPLALVNARLSEKSLKGYRLVSGFCRTTLGYINILAAQSQIDADRFVSLGVDNKNIFVTGNLKFDVSIPSSVVQEAELIKLRFGNRPVLITASTHKGEEEIIINAMAIIIKIIPDCLLIIAPRHPARAVKIKQLCEKNLFKTTCYTDNAIDLDPIQVIILDTLGILLSYYAAADIALVGGSLVPLGGHNLLEPAALGLPILSGKYLFNFKETGELLNDADALLMVSNAEELSSTVIRLFEDSELRQNMGARAKAVVNSNQGNINRLTKILDAVIP